MGLDCRVLYGGIPSMATHVYLLQVFCFQMFFLVMEKNLQKFKAKDQEFAKFEITRTIHLKTETR